MGLSMKTQVLAKVEDYEGVAMTLTASDILQAVLAGPSPEEDDNLIDRDLARQSLTHAVSLPGLRGSRFQFQQELVGPSSGFPTTPAPVATGLRAAGMKQLGLRRMTIAASWSAGTAVNDGETFTAAPSGATGSVWADWQVGDAYIVLDVLTGIVAAGDTLTFSGGAIVPVNASFVTQAMIGWRPEDTMLSQISLASVASGPIAARDELLGATSGARAVCAVSTSGSGAQTLYFERMLNGGHFIAGETINVVGGSASGVVSGGVIETQSQIPSLSLGAFHDGVIKQALKGSRGSWSARLRNGERGVVTFDFRGCGIKPVDAPLLTWPGTLTKTPPVVHGGLFSIDKAFLPNFSELTLDKANEVVLRESPNESTGTGYESAHIVARRPTGSIDPEVVREAIKPLFGNAWDKITFRLVARIGTGAADGNTFEFRCRKTQARMPRVGERNRIRAYTYPLLFNGDGDDEIIIFEW